MNSTTINGDGNLLGRLGAIVLIAAAGFGLHKLNCSTGEMCPVVQTDGCCAGDSKTAAK